VSALVLLPLAVPLLAAAAALVVPSPRARCALALGATTTVLATAVSLVVATRDGAVVAAQVGGWPGGVAIAFAADALSALLLCTAALVVATCLAYAAASGSDAAPSFSPLVLILSAGAYGAFLTGDLFSFFVLVEVMLAPSYGLLLLGGAAALQATRLYLSVNLLASTVLLAGVGLVFGATGTVNLGALAGAGRESPAVAVGVGVIAVALAVKAAVVPLHGWLPRSYPYAPPVVTALFSALLTKVAVYGLYRVYAVVLDGDPRYRAPLLALAVLGMVLGVLGALGARTLRDVLCHHMVSQIGYLLLGLALFTPLALAAAVFFFVQYLVVKAALLLVAAALEDRGHSGRVSDPAAPPIAAPLLSVGFLVAALSLAGLPPLSGFVAKLQLARAAADAGEHVALAAIVAVGLLTLMSMLKLWNGVFWNPGPGAEPGPAPSGGSGTVPTRLTVPTSVAAPVVVLAALSVLLGLGAEPLLQLAGTAAAGLLDPSDYVRAVLA